ncbi:regulator of microtubule dynamics protein 1-like [Dermatophagoides pteronyssinus]|uniref:regulator of microtubule dynamics protein 1-like n=1 Tax=Dermatophagoides pteronyssinus TaxID=6956 RepID=UPI003F66C0BE
MSRKTLFTGILCFVCGMLIGYATSLLTTNDDDHVRKRLKRNLSDNNDLVKTLRKDFEKEIHVLYEKLDAIHQELQLNKNKKINNKRNSDISSDETDQAECFYDTAEIFKDEIDEQKNDYQQIDDMFENDSIDVQYIYDYIKQKVSKDPNDAEMLWRHSKAAHLLSKSTNHMNNLESKKQLLYESFDMANNALKLNDHNANCHKWYAISIGCLKDFVSIKEKINNGIQFKEHLDIAMSLKDDDPTLYHLAGRFCLELLAISWAEKKLASMIVGYSLPEITYQDALQYFMKAYQLKPRWKENVFFIVQTLIQMNEQGKAHDYLKEALAIPFNEKSGEEQIIHDKLLKLQSSKFS